MADFRGFKCDGCGAVGLDTERTKITTSYDGPKIKGSVVKDLCPTCAPVPESVDGLQVPKAKGAKKAPSPVAAVRSG